MFYIITKYLNILIFNMSFISIILPNYNHEKFLQRRIDSILNQTYQNFELIILDDCSTDNSRDLLNTLRNYPRVSHIIYNKKNSGNTFKQWEKGLIKAKGELIWIAESDDSIDCSFLAKAVKIFQTSSSIGIVQCGSEWISETGIVIYQDNFIGDFQEINGQSFILNNMVAGNSLYNASAILFKKSLITLPLNSSILEFKYCGDWLFWVKILENTNLYIINENLNKFRRHTQTVSNFAERDGLFYLEGVKIYKYIKHKYPISDKYTYYNHYWASNFLLKDYPMKIILKFLIAALGTSIFIPFYMFTDYFKKSIILKKN